MERVPLPASASGVQNLTSIGEQIENVHQISARVDHRLTLSGPLFVRFSTFDAGEVQPFGTSTLQETLVPGFGRDVNTKARNLGSATRTCSVRA